jgi:hypothetical protein
MIATATEGIPSAAAVAASHWRALAKAPSASRNSSMPRTVGPD